jgi:hypothetical protein
MAAHTQVGCGGGARVIRRVISPRVPWHSFPTRTPFLALLPLLFPHMTSRVLKAMLHRRLTDAPDAIFAKIMVHPTLGFLAHSDAKASFW